METRWRGGLLDVLTPHGQVRYAGPGVVFGDDRESWRPRILATAEGDPDEASASRGPVRLRWVVDTVEDTVRATVSVRNDGAEPLVLWALEPLVVDDDGELALNGPPVGWSVFANGFQSWSGTRSWRTDEVDRDPPLQILRDSATDPAHRSGNAPGRTHSDLLLGVRGNRTGSGVVAGFLGAARQFGRVLLDVRGGRFRSLVASCDLDGVLLAPGEEVSSETVQLRFGADTTGLLEAQAADLGRAQQARVPERPPAGWCSWYYYFTKVTEADVRENLDVLSGWEPNPVADYVMIDDGHQSAIGDWLSTNDKFPSGMAALADHIRAAGFDAGIWLAPFLAEPGSAVATDHPEWILRDERGRPVTALWNPPWSLRPIRALDTSHPEVLDWIRHVAHTIRHDWGYRILKLDFLYAAAQPGVRHTGITRAAAVRGGLDAVREGAGEDAFLLGCGCPLGPAVGVVDGMRIGADVAPWWTNPVMRTVMRDQHGISTRHAVRNTLTRAFMHGRLWANDPDCLMVRDRDTRLDLEEVRTLATVMGLTDGMLVVSDRLRDLAEDRRAVIETAASFTGGDARVLDLFDSGLPEVIVSRQGDDLLVGVCNLTDLPAGRVLDLALLGPPTGPWPNEVTEVWTEVRLPIMDGRVDLGLVPPHGSRVLRFPGGGG
jgi:alpha-galactosidase